VVGVGRIGKQVDRAGATETPGADAGELDGGPTTDMKLTTIGIDDPKQAFAVPEDVEGVRLTVGYELPRLGVVHRRGPDCCLDDAANLFYLHAASSGAVPTVPFNRAKTQDQRQSTPLPRW